MKASLDKWLITKSEQGVQHIMCSEISAFTYDEKHNRLKIYLKGDCVAPFTLDFTTIDELKLAYSLLCKNLSVDV